MLNLTTVERILERAAIMEFDAGLERLASLRPAFVDVVGREPTRYELDRVAVAEVKMFNNNRR